MNTPIFQPDFNPNDYINFKKIPNGIELTHDNVKDVSLFEHLGDVTKVNLYHNSTDEINIVTDEKLENYYGLINKKTDKLLKCRPVSSTYKLIQHTDLFMQQADMLLNHSDLPTDNVTVCDKIYENGRRASRSIHFNDLKMNVGKNNDSVTCRLDVFNSVDQSWSFQVFSGAYRDLCRNTQVFGGEKAYQQNHKHTSGLEVNQMLSKASTSLQSWNENKAQMLQWKNTPLSEEKFVKFLADTLCKVKNADGVRVLKDEKYRVNQKQLNYLTQLYQNEVKDCGENLWGGYNTLTHWSTHTKENYVDVDGKDQISGNSKTQHTVQHNRQRIVRDLLNSDEWATLEHEGVA